MLLLSTDKSCRQQHEAVRSAVGVYYFTHHIIELKGPDALTLLEKLYVSNISRLVPTRGRYTMMLDENGFPQDDCVVTDLDEATPFATGMDWLIDWNKTDFIGHDAVLAAKDQPLTQKLVGITVDAPFTKVHGGCVSKNGKQIGRVTKFTYGFTLNKWVGFALDQAGSVQPGDHVTVDWNVDAVVAPSTHFLEKLQLLIKTPPTKCHSLPWRGCHMYPFGDLFWQIRRYLTHCSPGLPHVAFAKRPKWYPHCIPKRKHRLHGRQPLSTADG